VTSGGGLVAGGDRDDVLAVRVDELERRAGQVDQDVRDIRNTLERVKDDLRRDIVATEERLRDTVARAVEGLGQSLNMRLDRVDAHLEAQDQRLGQSSLQWSWVVAAAALALVGGVLLQSLAHVLGGGG
jgi:hypothetical protein